MISKVICIVPAAGVGRRMQSEVPKQYLPFRSQTILDHTLKRLLECDVIDKIVLAIGENDKHWLLSAYFGHHKIELVVGGKERADSVLNGLARSRQLFDQPTWVMVHDAARPCLMKEDVDKLVKHSFSTQKGAILAAPVHDTVKHLSDDGSVKTLQREKLWRALTPQMFELRQLESALLKVRAEGQLVTDEANAIELNGGDVELVEGRSDNLKVTQPTDMLLANYYVEQQEAKLCE